MEQGADQVLAGARGAQDAFTFGMGDRVYAGGRALVDAAHGADLGAAYRDRMAIERARDAYDVQNYATARTLGQVAGTGAQIAAFGPLGAAGGAVRMAEAAPMIVREAIALGGLGAAGGAGGQAVSDLARGHLGTAGDYGGAAIGGIAGVLAARGGRAGLAGAVTGSTTSRAQDLLNGRAISEDRARDAALVGGVLGAAGGALGRRWSSSLPIKAKGELGENFSRVRTRLRGDKTNVEPDGSISKTREYLNKQKTRYTYPDQRTAGGELVESKFGPTARLSPRQTEAYASLPNYRPDHWLPRDVGVVVGLPAADYGVHRRRQSRSW